MTEEEEEEEEEHENKRIRPRERALGQKDKVLIWQKLMFLKFLRRKKYFRKG